MKNTYFPYEDVFGLIKGDELSDARFILDPWWITMTKPPAGALIKKKSDLRPQPSIFIFIFLDQNTKCFRYHQSTDSFLGKI